MTTTSSSTEQQDLEDLVAFILRTSDPKRAKSSRCFHYVLVHERVDGVRDGISQDFLANSQAELEQLVEGTRKEQADAIAQTFLRAARTKAAKFPRMQSFEACAYTSAAQDKTPITFHAFNVTPTHQKAASLGLEDASMAGVVGQLQRTIETLGERVEGISTKLLERDSRETNMIRQFAEKHAELNVQIMGQLVTAMSTTQQALNEQNRRDIETQKAALDLEDRKMLRQFMLQTAQKVVDSNVGKHGSIVSLVRKLAKDKAKIRFFHDHVLETDEERVLLRDGLAAHLNLDLSGATVSPAADAPPPAPASTNGAAA